MLVLALKAGPSTPQTLRCVGECSFAILTPVAAPFALPFERSSISSFTTLHSTRCKSLPMSLQKSKVTLMIIPQAHTSPMPYPFARPRHRAFSMVWIHRWTIQVNTEIGANFRYLLGSRGMIRSAKRSSPPESVPHGYTNGSIWPEARALL